MQGTVVWRARLNSTVLPNSSHYFIKGVNAALLYPIGEGQFVWTVLAPVSRLAEVGLEPRTHSTRSEESKKHVSLQDGGPKGNDCPSDGKPKGTACPLEGKPKGNALPLDSSKSPLDGQEHQSQCTGLEGLSSAPNTPATGSQKPNQGAPTAHQTGGERAELSKSEVYPIVILFS